MGLFKDAIDLANAASDVRRMSLGPKHRVTLESDHKIGLIYQGLGEYRQAEDHLQIPVNERYQLLGLSHAHTLDSLHDLALLYKRADWIEDEKALEFLLSVGASLDFLSKNGFGSVHTAVAKGFVGVVTQHLDAGVDIEEVSENTDQ